MPRLGRVHSQLTAQLAADDDMGGSLARHRFRCTGGLTLALLSNSWAPEISPLSAHRSPRANRITLGVGN